MYWKEYKGERDGRNVAYNEKLAAADTAVFGERGSARSRSTGRGGVLN